MKRSPRETHESAQRIGRRALIIGTVQIGFAGLLGLRMRHVQVNQAEEYRLLAEENRISFELLPPVRGRIFDRNGMILADNEPTYRITLTPEDAGDVAAVVARLAQVIRLDSHDLKRALASIDPRKPFFPVTLADRVPWEEISRVEVNAPALPGIRAELGLSRAYPEGDLFAHVVGYVSKVSERNLSRYEDPPALLLLPGFQHGQVGVEARLENDLRGNAGTKRVEKNAAGRVMRELGRREGQAGADMQLTVDRDLTSYIMARLGEESASVVVMDVNNGDLLASVSAPSYDPNKFVRGISVPDYAQLREDDHRPLASKTVQDAYPPGSTFKMITALAAMEAGVMDPQDKVWCPGHMEVGNRRFHCWKREGHGNMILQQSLRESCDVYFYDLALKVGIERIADVARRLGLGEKHDIPMSAVTSGLVPDKAWKQRERGASWLIGDSVNASIGQGFILTSPLQLAVMTARLASGRTVSPRLVKTVEGVETFEHGGEDMGFDPSHLMKLREAMFSVSNDRKGTAYGSRIIADDMRMAGKTGTAQVSNRVVDNDTAPWVERDHALFVAFAPYDNPRIAVSVVVEHGGGGSRTAAPIARDVVLQALYGEDPPLDAYPVKDRPMIAEQQERLARARAARASQASRA